MNNKISFVIRTKNEGRDIEKVINSILEQAGRIKFEIIVVDSGSTDQTLEILKGRDVKILSIRPEDFTWGYALNYGIRQAEGDSICLISGHCVLANRRTIEKAFDILWDENNNIEVLYGRQIGDRKKNIFEYVELLEEYPDTKLRISNSSDFACVSNACCLLKKKIWEQLQFNEQLQSAEDAYWFAELEKNGYHAGYSGDFCVIHGHYFNAEYIYKKTFWRTYHFLTLKNFQQNRSKIRDLFMYYIVVHALFSIKKTIGYRKKMKESHCFVSVKEIFMYVLICEMAMALARYAVSHTKVEMGYEDISVPRWIKKLGVKIERKVMHYE